MRFRDSRHNTVYSKLTHFMFYSIGVECNTVVDSTFEEYEISCDMCLGMNKLLSYNCYAKLVSLLCILIAVSIESFVVALRIFMCKHQKHRNLFCIKDIFECYRLLCLLTMFYELLWGWCSVHSYCISHLLHG